MSDAKAARAPKDRSDAIVFMGVTLVIMALGALLMAVAFVAVMVAAPREMAAVTPATTAVVVAAYLSLAALFMSLGIGVSLVRRWAWSLAMVLSWTWLATGTVGLLVSLPVLDRVFAGMGPQPGMGAVRGVAFVFLALLLVVLPAVFSWFYSSRGVRGTFEASDGRRYWTDRCPLPVLSLALLSAFGALFLLVYVGLPVPFPMFGGYVRGVGARLLWLLAAAAGGFVAVRAYQVRRSGWIAAAVTWGLLTASSLVTMRIAGVQEMHAAFAGPSAAADLGAEIYGDMLPWLMIPTIVVYVAYLGWLYRFFPREG